MSITYNKESKRYVFQFDRFIQSSRVRVKRTLPAGITKKAAEKFDFEETARLLAEHSGQKPTDPLISSAILLYLKDKAELKSYKQTMEHLRSVQEMYQGKKVSELSNVSKLINAHSTWSPATKKNRLALLRAACRWAWKHHELTAVDPTHVLIMPQVKNARMIYPTRRDMLELASAARALGMRDLSRLIRLAFYSGMRLGELLSVRINKQGDFELANTKNGDRRIVPVHPRLTTVLKHLPLSTKRSTIQSQWRRVRSLVGMDHVHIHDLRHATASEMINNGVSLHQVGAVLGHRDPKSTMRYAHLQRNTLAAAIGRVGSRKST